MSNFQFLNRSIAYNSETEVAYFSNSVSGPLFSFVNIYISSPSGMPYAIYRLYLNGVLDFTFATPTVAQYTNILNVEENILLMPGGTLQITCVNLDPAQQTHSIEGQIE